MLQIPSKSQVAAGDSPLEPELPEANQYIEAYLAHPKEGPYGTGGDGSSRHMVQSDSGAPSIPRKLWHQHHMQHCVWKASIQLRQVLQLQRISLP